MLRNGLCFAGDLGRMDDEGFLLMVGRQSDVLKPLGFRVSGAEIENRLLEMEGVKEAAALGVENEFFGESVHIFLFAGSMITDDEVRTHLNGLLPTQCRPEVHCFLSPLPKTTSGKISKAELRELVCLE